MFPSTSSRETSGLEGKQNQLVSRGTVQLYIKCFVIYLDFHIAKTNKQRRRAGNNCSIVSRSGYI